MRNDICYKMNKPPVRLPKNLLSDKYRGYEVNVFIVNVLLEVIKNYEESCTI